MSLTVLSVAFKSQTRIKTAKADHAQLLKEVQNMKQERDTFFEDVVDLQSRSIRDNLLFLNFDEGATTEERKNENCSEKYWLSVRIK